MARWAETCGKDMYPGNIHLGHDSTVMDIETCHGSTFVLVKMHALVVGFEIMIVLRVKELWDRLLVFVLPLCQHTHLPSHNQTSIHSRWNRILGSFVISLADASSYFPSKSTSNHTCHEGWDPDHDGFALEINTQVLFHTLCDLCCTICIGNPTVLCFTPWLHTSTFKCYFTQIVIFAVLFVLETLL